MQAELTFSFLRWGNPGLRYARFDNAVMQRMSETMKVLTAFAAIFLPLTLITGIYGMNFNWMPELHWVYGYFFALGLIIFTGVGLYLIFKWKRWF